MKNLLRSDAVQGALAALLAAYLKACYATLRWKHENRAAAEAVWDAGGGVVVCFWHARIGLAPASWPLARAQKPRAMISLSRDGEFVARAMARIGFPAIRGSSTKAAAKDKAKGGAGAFREALRWLRAGNCVALTPDGPRGPAEQMAEGAPLLARVADAPALFIGAACKPAIRLGGWDRGVLPVPFARAALVWGGPLRADPDADLETLRADWAARLTAVTERAEALVAGAAR